MACVWTAAPAALLCLAALALVLAAGEAEAAAVPMTGDRCPADYTPCMDGDGCVPSEARCDGTFDCKDASDEFQCEATSEGAAGERESLEAVDGAGAGAEGGCLEDEHRCLDGTCISKARTCDGPRDCFDGSDEDALAGCAPRSGNATEGEAEWVPEVPPEARAGVDHLPQLQQQLPPRPCAPSEFRCGDGTCIPSGLTCNERLDCPDGSDERLACPLRLGNCHDDFRCRDGRCVPFEWVCNGVPDCLDESEEDPALCANWTMPVRRDPPHAPVPAPGLVPGRAYGDWEYETSSADPCERMEPLQRQQCWEDQLHKLKMEEVQARRRVAREALEGAQAEAAGAKELHREQLRAAQLQSQAAEELLQHQRELHQLRMQTLRRAAEGALPEQATTEGSTDSGSNSATPAE